MTSTYDRLSAWSIGDLGLKPAAYGALRSDGRFKTLAQLEAATDEELLAIHGVGPLAVKAIRRAVLNVRQSTSTLHEEVIAWLATHETLALALVRGEAVIVPTPQPES